MDILFQIADFSLQITYIASDHPNILLQKMDFASDNGFCVRLHEKFVSNRKCRFRYVISLQIVLKIHFTSHHKVCWSKILYFVSDRHKNSLSGKIRFKSKVRFISLKRLGSNGKICLFALYNIQILYKV